MGAIPIRQRLVARRMSAGTVDAHNLVLTIFISVMNFHSTVLSGTLGLWPESLQVDQSSSTFNKRGFHYENKWKSTK